MAPTLVPDLALPSDRGEACVLSGPGAGCEEALASSGAGGGCRAPIEGSGGRTPLAASDAAPAFRKLTTPADTASPKVCKGTPPLAGDVGSRLVNAGIFNGGACDLLGICIKSEHRLGDCYRVSFHAREGGSQQRSGSLTSWKRCRAARSPPAGGEGCSHWPLRKATSLHPRHTPRMSTPASCWKV